MICTTQKQSAVTLRFTRLCFLLSCLVLGTAARRGQAQFQAERYALADSERQQLTQARDHLKAQVDALREQSRKSGMPSSLLLPDVEIFLDAANRCLQQNLFFSKQNVQQALACLSEGETRAGALGAGRSEWTRKTGVVVLGYRSQIDGSAQPYQVYVPADYDFATAKPQRLDIFLHGRGGTLNEPSFIRGTGWVRGNFGPTPPPNLALYPYGRGNNGWRFAGERDVFEALADCQRRYPTLPNQITLRGFSMGGHGAWHIGLEHPGLWAALSPGAGFVETKRYAKITAPLTGWQTALLHLYDPLDYAMNARNLTLLPYVGETDTFHAQHILMYDALKRENVSYQDFLGPQTGHAYEKQTLQSLLTTLALTRRDPEDTLVDFTTYTLRWPECKWVRVEGLEKHWQQAVVHAQRLDQGRISITTRNVNALHLSPGFWQGGTLTLDGDTFRAANIADLVKKQGHWKLGKASGLRKEPGLQGPIDDALFGSVLAVSGTGTPWNADAGKWLGQEMQRFRDGWGMYFRATLPESTDAALTAADIKNNNLYLFGDPGSNAVLRRLLPRLPLHWTKDTLTVGGKTFTARDHLPLLIFPNPESPTHYVVLNTGFTFSRADQNGSNSLQFPHLPDYAVIHFDAAAFNDDRAKDTVLAGFFDENWRLSVPQ